MVYQLWTWGQLFNASLPQFPSTQIGYNKSPYLSELLQVQKSCKMLIIKDSTKKQMPNDCDLSYYRRLVYRVGLIR